jgi:alkanesulfonate monooxygenase SsuD/methylene tetrahydromethanopterin reductase-like flavin-dependent oxidoreductase (luciferase family)
MPEAQAAYDAALAHNGAENMGNVPVLLGRPATIADALRPYCDLGFSTVIVRLPAPYDRETIERIGEVDALLADA